MVWIGALIVCIMGAITLGVLAYLSNRQNETDESNPVATRRPPAERFLMLSLGDSPWGVWRPIVLGGGAAAWLAGSFGLPVYLVFYYALPLGLALLFIVLSSVIVSAVTMALLLLIDLAAMIAGIGAGEVGVIEQANQADQADTIAKTETARIPPLPPPYVR